MRTENREESIFLNALGITSASQRAAYVQKECGDDQAMLARIRALVWEHELADGPLDSPPVDVGPELQATDDSNSVNDVLGSDIGRYKIREQIGEGGMGVVYVAEQTEPVQRKVAIKIIKPGMDTKEVIGRFEAERQALAFMEHPNIARVLDAGATERGRSYFVMELVRGIPITEYCDQVKATTKERLELFMTVCDAVQHAHQKGIIHRDVKPSNVLVTQAGAKAVIKVIDFGLAKAISGQRLTEKTLYTGFMKLMGTPVYMSPEQAGLSSLDADTRSDIYSLGILLYELLTGTTPLDKTELHQQSYDDLCKQIREVEAPRPSARISTLKNAERSTVAQLRQIEPHRLRQMLNGDLDRIVLKAIDKDREMRYASPQDLAADIQRFLNDEPIVAVAPSTWYLTNKFVRRYKAAISVAAMMIVFLLAATAFSTWQAYLAKQAGAVAAEMAKTANDAKITADDERNNALKAKQEAIDARKNAESLQSLAERTAEVSLQKLYATDMRLADQLWNSPSGTAADIHRLLVNWIPIDSESSDRREFAWRYQWSRLHDSAEITVPDTAAASINAKGSLILADANGIRQWDDRRQEFVRRCHDVLPLMRRRIELSPCGRWAAVQVAGAMKVFDIQREECLFTIPGNRNQASFHKGGTAEFVVVWNSIGFNLTNDFQIWNIQEAKQKPLPDEIVAHLETSAIGILASVAGNGDSYFLHSPFELHAHLPDRSARFPIGS